MSGHLYIDQVFEKIPAIPNGDFEGCRFIHCHFSGADLSGINFTECEFDHCNLSAAKIMQTTFNEVKFIQSKLLGLHFETASQYLFTVRFEHCTLDFCSFYQCKMKKTVFSHCSLQETDFTETILTEADFEACNLRDARFENTVLEKADLRAAVNYTIDPEKNKIKMAKFSAAGALVLLDKYQLHID